MKGTININENNSFGDIRKLRGLSIDSAAEIIGIDKDLLIQYEDDPEDMPILTAKKIANAYKVDYNEISFIKKKRPYVI